MTASLCEGRKKGDVTNWVDDSNDCDEDREDKANFHSQIIQISVFRAIDEKMVF